MAAAFTLPAPQQRRVPTPVSVDLFNRVPEKLTPPEPPPPIEKKEAPKPEEHAASERSERPKQAASPLAPEPQKTAPEPSAPEPSETKPPGKVDLTLHALPGGSDNAVTVPNGTGTFGGTFGTNSGGGRKPWKMRGDAGNPLTGKVADEAEDRFPLKAIGGGEFEFKGKAFHARIARDGRVSFDDKSIRDFKGLSGGFDITDLAMRAKGQDPYRAEKQAFMENTEAMRKKMAQAALKERREASLGRLPMQLDEIWRDTRRPAKDRRLLLFETWKDASTSEEDVGDAAKEACAIIETYIRRYLPNGSEDCYTDDELERYNRGLRKRFAPYR